jgi:exodeoxyribonuclease VII large subunit
MSVLVRCKAGIYEGRGEYQLVIEHMEEAGFGALQRQYEHLKASLSKEGLFDPSHKKVIPSSICHAGIVTSPTGAAVRDVLAVLRRRFPSIAVTIYPTSVQGDEASHQIIEAISNANSDNRCDVLIVGRGGGSLEDLWPFNEESVARSIYNSRIPIVSAIGHEIDFTIADFVADLRAPTPSAAAELISPDQNKVSSQFRNLELDLTKTIIRRIQSLNHLVVNLKNQFQHPERKLQEQAQRLDHLDVRLVRAVHNNLEKKKLSSINLRDRLIRQNPMEILSETHLRLRNKIQQLSLTIKQYLNLRSNDIEQSMHLLDAVSPLRILNRGFSVIQNNNDDVIKTITSVKIGDSLKGRVSDGEIYVDVTKTISLNSKGDQ